MAGKSQQSGSDFASEEYAKKVDTLEEFRRGFEGKEFDKKVLNAIQDSSKLRDEIRKLSWQTIREKIVWIILGGVGIVLTDLVIRAIPSILAALS